MHSFVNHSHIFKLTYKNTTKCRQLSNRFFLYQTGAFGKEQFMNNNFITQNMEKLINKVNASPQIESEDFAQLMSETFNGLNCPVKYEHDFAMRRHSVWVPDCPQIADDITWTNATEVAQELTWFLKKYKDYEHTIDYLLNQAKGFVNQKPLGEEEFQLYTKLSSIYPFKHFNTIMMMKLVFIGSIRRLQDISIPSPGIVLNSRLLV